MSIYYNLYTHLLWYSLYQHCYNVVIISAAMTYALLSRFNNAESSCHHLALNQNYTKCEEVISKHIMQLNAGSEHDQLY